MAQRVEIGNKSAAELMRMGIQINLPMPPSNSNGGMYEKKLSMTCPGREKVM